jgi:hypothetical protein
LTGRWTAGGPPKPPFRRMSADRCSWEFVYMWPWNYLVFWIRNAWFGSPGSWS